jgi:LacI family transcriptional regulator
MFFFSRAPVSGKRRGGILVSPGIFPRGAGKADAGMTIPEIAALAGVSIGTVDRVLHKRGRVSGATRAKIEAIIERYRFTPNPIARRLKRGRPYRFCALLPRRDQDAGYWKQIIDGIALGDAAARPLGVETETHEYDRYNPDEAAAMVARVLSREPDGLITAPIVTLWPLLEQVRSRRVPSVFVDSDFPEMEAVSTISQDPLRGGRLAGRLLHLFTGTRERPAAVLDVHSLDYNIIRRRDGFLGYAAERGFPAVVKEYAREEELSREEIARFLAEHPRLSGMFVTNCLAHRAARAVREIRPEKDLAIIGYDLIPGNRELLREGYIDAIISQRPEEQGRRAVENLYRHIVLEEPVERRIDIPLDIYLRENIPENGAESLSFDAPAGEPFFSGKTE